MIDILAQTYQMAAGNHDTFMIQSWKIRENTVPHTARPNILNAPYTNSQNK